LPRRGDPCAHRRDGIRHSRAALRRGGARRVGTRRRRDTLPWLGTAGLHRSGTARYRRRVPESDRPAASRASTKGIRHQCVSPGPAEVAIRPDNVFTATTLPEAG
jgi:hypothetical protein